MAADLHHIVQRMEKLVPNRTETRPRWWFLLAVCLVLIAVLLVGFSRG